MSTRTYDFKKGSVVPLDNVYDLYSLIPVECYEQDDPADKSGDGGETIRFVKSVTIKISTKVSED